MSEKVQVVILKKSSSNEDYYALLLQTNKTRGHFWQNITGGVEDIDTNIFAAAQREISEEINVEQKIENIVYLDKYFEYFDTNRKTQFKEHLFLSIIPSDSVITISGEHVDYKWCPLESLTIQDFGFESSYQAISSTIEYLKKGTS